MTGKGFRIQASTMHTAPEGTLMMKSVPHTVVQDANRYTGTWSRAPSMWSAASLAASSGVFPFSRATM
jgi:hypothetical protein